MATASRPAVRPKKKSPPVLPIVLGLMCLGLLAGLIFIFLQHTAQTAQMDRLKAGVLQVATAAESDAVTADTLADAEALPEAMEGLANAVAGRVTAARTAQAELVEQRTETERARAEQETVMQQLRASRSQADGYERELTETRNEVTRLQEQHAAELSELRTQMDDLSGQLTQAQTLVEELEAKAARADVMDEEPQVMEAAEPGAPALEEAESPLEMKKSAPVARRTKSAAMDEMKEGDPDQGVPVEVSELFKRMDYDSGAQRLSLTTLDGKQLTYTEVTEDVHGQLLAAPSFDIYFRSRILLNFPSDPDDDVELIRSIRR